MIIMISQRHGTFKLQEIELVLGSAVAASECGARIVEAVTDIGVATRSLQPTRPPCDVIDSSIRWRRRAWVAGREGIFFCMIHFRFFLSLYHMTE